MPALYYRYFIIIDWRFQSTQFKRAGGTMCFQNQEVWKTYQRTITFFAACPVH